jgi:F-type H+-transporting ATPase subunit epsilon
MAQKRLNIELATPTSKRNIGEALSCSAPGVLGKFQILPDHTAFISELAIGEMKIELPDKTQHYAISGGFLEVADNRVLLLLETAESAEEIDIQRADQAKERAQERLHSRDPVIDVIRAETALARALNRLKVAQRASP